jgi:hypothetical protein
VFAVVLGCSSRSPAYVGAKASSPLGDAVCFRVQIIDGFRAAKSKTKF